MEDPKYWTDEEKALLAELVPDFTHDEIGALLGRTVDTVRSKARDLRLLKCSPAITEAELALVEELMAFMPYSHIGKLIGRSGGAVERMVKRYLTSRRPPTMSPWSPEESATLRALYPTYRSADIAMLLGRTLFAVYDRAALHGLRKASSGRVLPLMPQALRDVITLTRQLKEKVREREQRENDRRPPRRPVSTTRHPGGHL